MKHTILFTALSVSFSCFLLAREEPHETLVVKNRHVVAEIVGSTLHITDAVLVNVLSPEGSTSPLIFSIPKGYQDFEILNGLDPTCLSLQEEHIVDSSGLPPGKAAVAFRYVLPIRGNTADLSFQVYQDTEVFYFLVKDLEVTISSEQLVDEGLIDMGERSFHALSAVAFRSGERFTITISGLGKQARRKQVLVFASIVIIVLIVIAAFVFKRGRPEGKPESVRKNTLLEERKRAFVSIIALLDEKHEKGELGETVYRELRNEYKAKLQRIIDILE
jgi:hypothetical protein